MITVITPSSARAGSAKTWLITFVTCLLLHTLSPSATADNDNNEPWRLIQALTGGVPVLFGSTGSTLFIQTDSGNLHTFNPSRQSNTQWRTAEGNPVPLEMVSVIESNNTLWAAGRFSKSNAYTRGTIYNSQDGIHWETTGLKDEYTSLMLAEHKNTIWAAANDPAYKGLPNLFTYDPNINKWIPANTDTTDDLSISSLVSNNEVLAFMDSFTGNVYYSSDDGKNWYKATQQPTFKGGLQPVIKAFGERFLCYQPYDDTFFANEYMVFMSADGNHWEQLPGLTLPKVDHILDVTADDNGIVYVVSAQTGVHKGTPSTHQGDGSTTYHWVTINKNLPMGTNALTMYKEQLWAAAVTGTMSIFDPQQQQWNETKTLNDVVILRSAQSNDSVYLAVASDLIYKKDIEGQWQRLTYDLEPGDRKNIIDFGVQGDLVFLINHAVNGENVQEILYYSTDGGAHRSRIVLPEKPVGKYVIRKFGNNFLLGSGEGVFYTTNDDFQHWQKSQMPTKKLKQNTLEIYDFAGNEQTTFASTSQGVLKSTDQGKSWAFYNKGLGSNRFGSLTYDNDDLYFAVSPLIGPTAQPIIFRRGLQENAWRDISHDLEYGEFLYTRVATQGKTVMLARNVPYVNEDQSGGGVYASFDRGDHWLNTTGNLPSVRPNRIHILGNQVIVATRDSGVFVADITTPIKHKREHGQTSR